MPREKNERVLNFKPQYKSFIPQDKTFQGETNLLHEEIEAIYLMDVLNLYQEDAAKKMQVSRTTFTRIIKNARTKLANALICGHKINIQDQKDDFIVAFCANDPKNIDDLSIHQANNIYIYHINKENYTLIQTLKNTAKTDEIKPTIALLPILLQHNVNFFIANKIGEGFKNTLISKGIQPIIKQTLRLEELAYMLK